MAVFSVVVPSANPRNLEACLGALFGGEPDLPYGRVVVVDDGGAPGAEKFHGVMVVPGVKPFVFARNCNIGISVTDLCDIVLLNDDALLETRGGLSRMAADLAARPDVGICSAAIRGRGKPEQTPLLGVGIKECDRPVSFCCALLTERVLSEVGLLDERFTAYGFEDEDLCVRAWKAGLKVAVHHGCVVRHEDGRRTRPTYAYLPGFFGLAEEGERIFKEKWNRP